MCLAAKSFENFSEIREFMWNPARVINYNELYKLEEREGDYYYLPAIAKFSELRAEVTDIVVSKMSSIPVEAG